VAIVFEHSAEGSTDEADVTTGAGFGTPWNVVSKTGALTIKYDSAISANGTRSIRLTRPATTDNGYLLATTPTAVGRLQARAYVWMSALPTVSTDLFVFRTTTFSGYVSLTAAGVTAGRLVLRNAAGATINASVAAANFPLSQWVRIEAVATKGTTITNGRFELAYYLGNSGTAVHTYDTGAAVNSGTADYTGVRFGLNGASIVPPDLWYDDVALGDGATGFIGPSTVTPPTLITSGSVQHVIDARGSTVPSGTISYTISQTAGPTVCSWSTRTSPQP
jgi:hypothetical protein